MTGIACAALLALAAPVPYRLVPELQLELGSAEQAPPPAKAKAASPAPAAASSAPGVGKRLKSPGLALGLTLATELPTLLLGPASGLYYAGEMEHFWITGGGRVGIFVLLYVLEKFVPAFGIGPLYAVTQPGHLGASFAAYPIAFPVDLLLLLGWVGSAGYDAVDSWFAVKRANARIEAAASGLPGGLSGLAPIVR